MLQQPVDWVALSRPHLVQISVDALASLSAALPAVPPAKVLGNFLVRQDRLGDLVQHEVQSEYISNGPMG